jgi:hypothetical protein
MDRPSNATDPDLMRKEMLRGNYTLKDSSLTKNKKLYESMAAEPMFFFMYKRGDFETKSVERFTSESKKRLANLAQIIITILK